MGAVNFTETCLKFVSLATVNRSAAVFALVLFSAPAFLGAGAFAQESSSRYGMGGQTQQFGQIRKQLSETGQPFRIEGHCQSACTMFLGLKNACVDPNAELLFHAG